MQEKESDCVPEMGGGVAAVKDDHLLPRRQFTGMTKMRSSGSSDAAGVQQNSTTVKGATNHPPGVGIREFRSLVAAEVGKPLCRR